MSKIEVNQVDPQSGTTLTLGTSGDTVSIPSGVTLANAGTVTGFASIAWQSSIVTASTLTAVAGRGYWLDTSSNAITVTLPGSAAVGDRLIFTDYARNWGTNAVTINQNSLNFQGNSSPNPVYDTNGESIDIVYSGATKGWIPNTDGAVALETAQTYSADFLVIAGGGSGGNDGGGGGAGGYRTSTQAIFPGSTYTVTVGDGGAAGSIGTQNNGSNSSISGTGITTITSAGGGAGGFGQRAEKNGTNGGSGGGGGSQSGATNNGAGGSGDTPATTPSQGNNGGTGQSDNASYRAGGGGGGAGAVGENSSTPAQPNNDQGGAGGAGTASSITGSSVTRGGGGGGRGGTSYASPGGAGGGGNGGGSLTASAGTANTGGGGGSNKDGSTGIAGGSGVVIISVPDANYSSTTTGSPTVDVNAGGTGKTVLTFNGDGSYTA